MSKLLLTAALALGLGGIFLLAKNKTQTSSDFVPVQTIVTVEARHGKDIPALNPEDLKASQRQKRLQVTDVVPLQGENAGLELFFLLDDASNTSVGSQFGDVRHFIETQPATTAVGIGYMQHGTVDIVQDLTTDRGHAEQALRLPLWSGGASPYLSLSDLIKRWPATSSRREVVMVTSGVDAVGGTGPMDPFLDAAIDSAQRNGVVVYAIYMPSAGHAGHSPWIMNWAQSHLGQIAEETGGEAYMLGFEPSVSFGPYLDDVTAHLAHQYRVTVLLKPAAKAGFQDVRFATEVPNAELLAAKKVYVPAGH
jgi:hypothetical protein